jgi:hypothetical protein
MMAPHLPKRSIQKLPVSNHFYLREKEFAVQWQCSRLCGDRLRLLQGFTSNTDLLVLAVNQTSGPSLKGYWAELAGYPTARPAEPA